MYGYLFGVRFPEYILILIERNRDGMKNNKSIYIAGPFFNDMQVHFEESVSYALHNNITVGAIFRPKHIKAEEEFGSKEWKHTIFETDVTAIKNSDIVVAIGNFQEINGELIVDTGTAYELGLANGLGKPIVFVHIGDSDDLILNVMIDMGTQFHITGTLDSVMKQLTTFDFTNIVVKRKNWKTT